MRKFAVLSATADVDYSFPVPVACAAWSRWGYKPLLFIVGDGWETSKAKLSMAAAEAMGARLVRCPVIGYWPADWWAKIIRLTACLVVEHDTDYLVTSDADMVLLDGDWLDNINLRKQFHIHYANAYQDSHPHVYPICYIGGAASVWKNIVRHKSSQFGEATQFLLRQWSQVGRLNRQGYFDDEHVLAWMLCNWHDYPHTVQRRYREEIEPEFPARRIQRDCLPVENPIDFHLPHPANTKQGWAAIERYVYPVLWEEQRRQLTEYWNAYAYLG